MTLKTFTTRVDTIYAATFIVMAPEHPEVLKVTKPEYKTAVVEYQKKTALKSERERQINKEKTGVFTGSYVKHPLTGERLPIWVADFVLPNYGTGVVMANAHDERDYEFAKKYRIKLKETIKPAIGEKIAGEVFTEDGILFDSEEFSGLDSNTAREKITKKLEKLGKGKTTTNFKFRDWVFSRQRYWGEPFPLEYLRVEK